MIGLDQMILQALFLINERRKFFIAFPENCTLYMSFLNFDSLSSPKTYIKLTFKNQKLTPKRFVRNIFGQDDITM